MKPEELRIIVEQAIAGGFNSAWLMVALVSLISAGIGSFFGSYMKKKGENLATKEDFRQILEQLTEQVSATEQIKADIAASKVSTTEQIKQEISNDYWKAQERLKIKRVKLEELVGYAFELNQLINSDSEKLRLEYYVKTDEIFNRAPTQSMKIEMISMLYFDAELRKSSIGLLISYSQVQDKIVEKFNHHKNTLAKKTERLTEDDRQKAESIRGEIGVLYKKFIDNMKEFESEAKRTLHEMEKS